ncbi:MAG: hypothetical protein H7289_07850 [Mucilaginibacter sp.]|nr:hypothetical protein [Mucilaginibacter sp.]
MFDTQEVAWADLSIRVFDTTVKANRGTKYKKESEKEHLYAAGNEPIGIQTGNAKYDGSLKILKSGLDKLNAAAKAAGYSDITQVPYQVIILTVSYKEGFGRAIQTDQLRGLSFSAFEKGMDQGAKFMEVELPFIYLELTSK